MLFLGIITRLCLFPSTFWSLRSGHFRVRTRLILASESCILRTALFYSFNSNSRSWIRELLLPILLIQLYFMTLIYIIGYFQAAERPGHAITKWPDNKCFSLVINCVLEWAECSTPNHSSALEETSSEIKRSFQHFEICVIVSAWLHTYIPQFFVDTITSWNSLHVLEKFKISLALCFLSLILLNISKPFALRL